MPLQGQGSPARDFQCQVPSSWTAAIRLLVTLYWGTTLCLPSWMFFCWARPTRWAGLTCSISSEQLRLTPVAVRVVNDFHHSSILPRLPLRNVLSKTSYSLLVPIPLYPKTLFYYLAPPFPVSRVLLLEQLWQDYPLGSAPALRSAPFSTPSPFPPFSAASALVRWFHRHSLRDWWVLLKTLQWEYHSYHQAIAFVKIKDGL